MNTITYVKKDRRIYDHSHCLLCGDSYGICKGEHKAHPPTTCLACGTPQCWTNGMGRGQCSVCYIGLLSKFGAKHCGYKRCSHKAVAAAPRVKYVCREHLPKAKLVDYITKAIFDRTNKWELIEFDMNSVPIL